MPICHLYAFFGLLWWLRRQRICLQFGRPGLYPWVGKIPWRRAWQPTPVFFPGEFPWTEDPGRIQSMGSQRIEYDWTTKHVPSLEKYLFRSSAHFSTGLFVLLLNSGNCLYILEIRSLSVTSFANIFSQSVGSLFILFMFFFAVQKVISLIRSHFLILLLFLLPWETDLRNHWYDLCPKMFCLCSPLKDLWCHILYLSF